MPPLSASCLWNGLGGTTGLRGRRLWLEHGGFPLEALVHGSALDGRLEDLRGRSILIATKDQLAAALALIELDGVAHRMVLCPPGVPLEYLSPIAVTAGVDAVVAEPGSLAPVEGAFQIACAPASLTPLQSPRRASEMTEWILLTSGTTGLPKLAVHTFATLTGAIARAATTSPTLWSTFYDVRRYGGLQILLRAMLGTGSMVLSSPQESVGEFLTRAGTLGITHISGTPTHWRRALMSPVAAHLAPRYVRLSGEIADQAILDQLRVAYPEADIAHAFASTEAGVAFDVGDGLAGFPDSLVEPGMGAVDLRVVDGSLCIRSARTALRYLGDGSAALHDRDGYVDTGDMVELRADRYHFVGRRGGIINIGGLKVHPEEVEAVINRQPHVQVSLVRARKNPILGTLVVADVVTASEYHGTAAPPDRELKHAIIASCREALPRHKVPAVVNIVPALHVAASGKLVRPHA